MKPRIVSGVPGDLLCDCINKGKEVTLFISLKHLFLNVAHYLNTIEAYY